MPPWRPGQGGDAESIPPDPVGAAPDAEGTPPGLSEISSSSATIPTDPALVNFTALPTRFNSTWRSGPGAQGALELPGVPHEIQHRLANAARIAHQARRRGGREPVPQ